MDPHALIVLSDLQAGRERALVLDLARLLGVPAYLVARATAQAVADWYSLQVEVDELDGELGA